MAAPIKVDDDFLYFTDRDEAVNYYYDFINRKYEGEERFPKQFLGQLIDGWQLHAKKGIEDIKSIKDGIVNMSDEKRKDLTKFLQKNL